MDWLITFIARVWLLAESIRGNKSKKSGVTDSHTQQRERTMTFYEARGKANQKRTITPDIVREKVKRKAVELIANNISSSEMRSLLAMDSKDVAKTIRLRTMGLSLSFAPANNIEETLAHVCLKGAMGDMYRRFRLLHPELVHPESRPKNKGVRKQYTSTHDLLSCKFRKMAHIVTLKNFTLHAPEDLTHARLYVATIIKLHRRGFNVDFALLDRIEKYVYCKQEADISFYDFLEQLEAA